MSDEINMTISIPTDDEKQDSAVTIIDMNAAS